MKCQFPFPHGKLYFLIWSSCWGETPNGKWALISQQTRKHRVEYPVHWGHKKIPVRVGVSVLPFLAVTLLNEAYMRWKQQNGLRLLETSLKIGKMAAASRGNLFWLSFQDVFWTFSSRCLPLTGLGQIQRKTNKQNVFIVFIDLKDFGGFKGRRGMSRFAFACHSHPEFNSSL